MAACGYPVFPPSNTGNSTAQGPNYGLRGPKDKTGHCLAASNDKTAIAGAGILSGTGVEWQHRFC